MLKYLLRQLRGYHVLVRVENTVVTYINHKVDCLFLSLRAIHIPGSMNVGTYLLSRRECWSLLAGICPATL